MMKALTVLLAGIMLFSCSEKENPTAEENPVISGNQIVLTALQIKTAGIETGKLNNQSIANRIMLTGTIEVPPTGRAGVSSSVGGIVKTARFMPGNYVSRGQTLAVIENPDLAQLQLEYLQTRAQLEYAQKDYDRQTYLNRYQASSDKVVQRAAAEVKNQRAAAGGLSSRLLSYGIRAENISPGKILKSASVVAPISGYVSTVNITQGQYVSPAEILYEIVNSSSTHLALKVFEKDLNRISVGQRVFGFTNQNPAKKHQARVALIGKDFSPDRSVLVHCELADQDSGLIPGTFMNAEIEVNEEEGFVIQEDAVVTWEGRQYIFEEIKLGTFKMFPVNIGNTENGFVELNNLDSALLNKKFVLKGAYQILMALKNVEE
ncbi:MAG: efflux RND transporter periplasmic adaptor subunit [Kaistella sp.]|nr:efflux RND transporter periplasmic adaptor subunit [Kaistella sp.]